MRRQYLISCAIILISALISALIIWAIFSIRPPKTDHADTPSPIYVSTLSTKHGDWSPMHRLPGQIQAKQQISINSSQNATVSKVWVNNGQQVQKGDPIIFLHDHNAQAELQRLQAQQQERLANQQMQQQQQQLDIKLLALDQQQLKNSQANLKREMALLNTQLTSSSRIEQAQAEVARAKQTVLTRQMSIANHAAQTSQIQAQLQQTAIAINNAQRQLEQLQLTAEFDGIIANLTAKQHQQISSGQALFTLYNAEQLYFHTQVSQSLAQQAQPEIEFQQQRHRLSELNPWLDAANAGQTAIFALQNSDAVLNSYQYAYWISPPVTNSFLLSKRALFDFERVYYLKALDSSSTETDNSKDQSIDDHKPTKLDNSSDALKNKTASEQPTHNKGSSAVFELVEVNVQLHGYTWHEGKEYYIATAEAIPADALLLSSKIKPLYSGLQVTNQLPIMAVEQVNTDKNSNNKPEQ